MHVFRDLAARERERQPVRVGVIGAGFFGGGVIRQLVRTPGVTPAVIANRTPDRAVDVLRRCGVPPADIRVCDSDHAARLALDAGRYVVTGDLSLPPRMDEIEVISETTGNMIVGATAALDAFAAGKQVVSANPEVQCTVGAILRQKADRAGVVYSDMDGDQPGIVQKLYEYVSGIGLTPVVAGNCKGVLKRYATPETQAAFCRANNIKPWIATAAADGTKLSIEMCTVANANDMVPAVRGMMGVSTSLETLLADFEKAGLLDRGPIVEFTLGIPVGVFIVAHSADPWIAEEMQYFKMGAGPYYLFFSPHVLCQFDSVPSIAEAALYGSAVITPLAQGQRTEVATFAKEDLVAGERLDGIGGRHCYGLLVSREEFLEHGLLPIGLAEFVRLQRDVARDEPILASDVEFVESNTLTELREEQDQRYGAEDVAQAQIAR